MAGSGNTVHRIADESVEERAHRMRQEGCSWHHIAKAMNISIPEAQRLAVKQQRGVRTLWSLLG